MLTPTLPGGTPSHTPLSDRCLLLEIPQTGSPPYGRSLIVTAYRLCTARARAYTYPHRTVQASAVHGDGLWSYRDTPHLQTPHPARRTGRRDGTFRQAGKDTIFGCLHSLFPLIPASSCRSKALCAVSVSATPGKRVYRCCHRSWAHDVLPRHDSGGVPVFGRRPDGHGTELCRHKPNHLLFVLS